MFFIFFYCFVLILSRSGNEELSMVLNFVRKQRTAGHQLQRILTYSRFNFYDP